MANRPQLIYQKNRMISEHLMARGITNQAVINAFNAVPRELFVPEHLYDLAYQDTPLPLDHHQTISQPYIVALMCQLLQLKSDDRILDIGTGSGYQAAILSRIVNQVITLEINPELAASAQQIFNRLAFKNIKVLVADGSRGMRDYAPFNGIKSAAAVDAVPKAWIDQLQTGGRIVTPVSNSDYTQNLIRLIKTESNKILEEDWGPVRFVPLIHSIPK